MNIKDIFSDIYDTATPWRFSGSEWKQKIRNSDIGSPIHGLKAGEEMTKLGSAYRGKQAFDRIRDGQNPLSRQFIDGMADDQLDNVHGAFKENWPVLAFMLAGAGLGGGAGGGSSGAAGGGGVAAGGGGAGLGIDAAGGLTYAGAPGSTAVSSGNAAYATGSGAGGFSMSSLGSGLGQLGGMLGGGGQQQPMQQQQPQQMQPVTPIAPASAGVNSRGLGQGQIDPQLLALLMRQLRPASGGYV